MLLHSYLAERQKDMRAEYQRTFDPDRRGAGGADSASGGNPCVALQTNKMDWGHPPGPYGNGTHSRVAELERAAGLYSDKLRTMTAVEVIDKKIGILRQALTESVEFTPAEINAKLAKLRQQAIDHAKTIFKPCSLAARGLFP